MKKEKIAEASGSLAAIIGKSLLAGLAGTAAITISQMIEMKINDREPFVLTGSTLGALWRWQGTPA